MNEPNFQKILKGRTEFYGKTEAAYEFAAEEYARQLAKDNPELKIRVCYATEFGSDVTILDLEGLESFIKDFEILSLTWEKEVIKK